jgi:hypothetical protein
MPLDHALIYGKLNPLHAIASFQAEESSSELENMLVPELRIHRLFVGFDSLHL